MLINKTFHDVPSPLDGGRPIRIFVIAPVTPDYPQARFPGVVVFSEIYQVTGPVERFAGAIASQGYVVACPSTYHEFESPDPIPYDVEGQSSLIFGRVLTQLDPQGTDRGNKYKIEKTVAAYDEDATQAIDLLVSLSNCNGRIAGHYGHVPRRSPRMILLVILHFLEPTWLQAFRAAFDPRVLSTVCFFATDIHSASLGKGGDNTLVRVQNGDLAGKGELVMIFGKQDTHVPRVGRDLIRKTLEDGNIPVSFLEVQAQHAFIRDEHSKGRWDAALTRSLFSYMMEVFERTVGRDLGPKVQTNTTPEHVC
ncbi:Dienelactone hydrolase [Mycena indigotica]|uniref:Dienelactone hydrolase n=1 Tax=Mycena indigotica TaxID=2126181 RepID=A0A8H6SZ60_9AGAR|nr:Dienelactone hydrolase [Mycena indigotica]KAF7306972.1 Dienelactone hydrolase [Mycena indigotica]